MDPKKRDKRRSIALGATSGTLAALAAGGHKNAKDIALALKSHKWSPQETSKMLAEMRASKMVRNALGVGAAGTGVGTAYLVSRYLKNKKKNKT
jgi:hypothetical protein